MRAAEKKKVQFRLSLFIHFITEKEGSECVYLCERRKNKAAKSRSSYGNGATATRKKNFY